MSEHRASITWKRITEGFEYETYNREHEWSFAGGVRIPASAAPDYRGRPEDIDPEEAFVAALSSCHMLTFLAIAARKRLVVDAYEDEAVGHLEANAQGKLAVTRVVLRPRVRFGAAAPSSDEEFTRLHDKAHHGCFIANSVLTAVTVEAVQER